MKWAKTGYVLGLIPLMFFLFLGSLLPLAMAETSAGMKVTVESSKKDPVVVVRSELLHIPQNDELKGTWTFTIDGVGKQTVSNCQGMSCEAVFNQHFFTVGKDYIAKVTFDAADPGGVPKHAEATKLFSAPPPYGQAQSYPIRCSLAYDLNAERSAWPYRAG